MTLKPPTNFVSGPPMAGDQIDIAPKRFTVGARFSTSDETYFPAFEADA